MRTPLVLLLVLLVPVPAFAWGFEAHRFVSAQVIALLPPELRPLFEKHRDFFVERSVDPDLWRNAGFDQEPPNHFVDLDYREFGPYPFDALPREYDRAIQKFGRDVIHSQGMLPWRTAEFYGKLQREFEVLKRKSPPPFALTNIAFYAAVLSHYVGDGHVPLHAVVNYDGQLTEQHGVHGRWESELFERNRTKVRMAPKPAAPVADPRAFMFDVLLVSNRLAEGVLAADLKAAAGREFYDAVYYDAFAADQLPVVERRLNESATAIASVIIGAWEAAGRPTVPLEITSEPRRVRRQPQ